MANEPGRSRSPAGGQCPPADFDAAVAATEAIIGRKQSGRSIAVLCIDIDSFGDINESYGVRVGSLTLQEVWRRLQELVRKEDQIFRIGDDEYAIILGSILHEEHAAIAAQRLQRLFDRPIEISGEDIEIRVRVGIAVYPEPASNAPELFRQATKAMQNAKHSKDGFAVYHHEPAFRDGDSMRYIHDLHQAIVNNEIVFHLQPVYGFKEERIIGAEALARWPLASGTVPAEEFIPVVEQAGLTGALTNLALNSTLREWAGWENGVDMTVSVNLSMQELADPELPDMIRRALGTWRVDPASLTLEVTETVIMQNLDQTVSVLSALSSIGVSIAIDDFGSGYSSLSYLRQLPVDSLKIDKQFVIGLQPDSGDLVLVEAIINLAHSFGLKVTAEGVETETGFRLLRELGCDSAQGNHISPPLSPERWQQDVLERFNNG